MRQPDDTRPPSTFSSIKIGLFSFLVTSSMILLSYNLDADGSRFRSLVGAATDQDCS